MPRGRTVALCDWWPNRSQDFKLIVNRSQECMKNVAEHINEDSELGSPAVNIRN